MQDLALLILRFSLAVTFLYHGIPKLLNVQPFVNMLGNLGVPLPLFFAWVVAIVEVGGGLLLLIGLWVRWVSIPLIINMLAAIFLVHLRHGFDFTKGGYEANLWLLAMLFALLLQDAGAYSVGKFLKKSEG
ncbi:MAG: DoxX family protein [bacterium]